MPPPRRFLLLTDAFGFGAGFFPAVGFVAFAGTALAPVPAAGLALSPIRVRLLFIAVHGMPGIVSDQ